uniref:Uncharacterized protein n=1 Tax=Arundo donax TaxID=35708 RepID=A0A0A9B3X0_ARUDO
MEDGTKEMTDANKKEGQQRVADFSAGKGGRRT